ARHLFILGGVSGSGAHGFCSHLRSRLPCRMVRSHPAEPTFQPDLYAGTAADYDRYRLSYPAELGEWIAAELSLDGSGRLLDLGAGTGQVARLLRPYFARVVVVEAESEMVDYG